MAKNIPNVDILTETFDTWLNRTNSVIDLIGSEVVTANTTLGVTGSPTAPLNARLWGSFTANTVAATTDFSVAGSLSANTSRISITAPIAVNGSLGTAGQILSSTGTGVSWASIRIDTLTSSGLQGGPITSTGSLSVNPGDGIVVDARGVSVDIPYISSQITGVSTLDGFTWSSPGALGTVAPNSGTFTTVTANSYRITGVSTDNFLINGTTIKTSGNVDALTPGDGVTTTTGGVRIRSRGTGRAALQFVNEAGTTQFGVASVDSAGRLYWSGNLSSTGFIGNGSALTNITGANVTGSVASATTATIADTVSSIANHFTSGTGVGVGSSGGSTGNWCRLPNGMLLQWGTIPATQDSTSILYFPQAFSTAAVAVTVSGGVRINSGAGENPATVTSVSSTNFTIWQTENVNVTAWWIAMGF